jgi:hypothetical protein
MTTLHKPDGTRTAHMIETLTLTLEQLIQEDNIQDDTDYHREIQALQNDQLTHLTTNISHKTK